MDTKPGRTGKDIEPLASGRGRIMQLKHGLFLELKDVDHRTKLGRSLKSLKNHLREYVGNPNPATELLIQRIAYKAIKLGLYESSALADLQNSESAQYLPLSESMRRDLLTLRDLGATRQEPVSYEEAMKLLGGKT